MKRKIKKYLMLLAMAVGMLLSTAIPVFAYADGEGQQEIVGTADAGTGISDATGSGSTEETPITEEPSGTGEETDNGETSGRVQGSSFSVPGNGQLVDDLSEDESKQFLTIQTKNGNTFFMVLDRSNNTENVYMLSMIDENDLAEFIDEAKKEPEQEKPSVVIPETENPSVVSETEKEPETEVKKDSRSTGTLLAVVLLFVGGIGGFYYFKVLKPKQDGEEDDSEDLEFYDGGAYINEDQENLDESGEE